MRTRPSALHALPLLALVAAFGGCARTKPPLVSSAVGDLTVTDPRRAAAPLLGREAPNTTMVAMGAGIAGDRISGLLEIPEPACAVVIARAGESIEDLDLFAYGEDGTVVGTDEAPDKTPGVVICPPHPRRVWIAARIAAGHGLVAIGAQRVAPAASERTAALYGIQSGAASGAQRVGAWAGLEERIEAHRTYLGGAWQDVRRVGLPLDARIPTRLSAQVEAGRCLDALVLPSDEVGHLELTVLDPSGAIIGRAENSGRERYLVVCSPSDAELAFEVRPQSGRGLGVLMLSRSRPGSERDIDPVITRLPVFPQAALAEELREFNEALAKSGYGQPRQLATGTLEVGRRTSTVLTVPAGCSRLDVVGGAPLRGIEAWVWSANGTLMSHGRGGSRATLFVCGPAGAARLDLEATLRSGPFSAGLRPEPDTARSLADNPLAAGRLLAQAIDRGVLRKAADVGEVRELALSPTALSTLDLTVPFGRCVDVGLALGADALGAEIRLVAAETGAQVALARGPHATSARVCSLEAATAHEHLKTRAELRVRTGSGKALVSTRLLSPTR